MEVLKVSKKNFTRREIIWMGALGIAQLGVLGNVASGWWNQETDPERPKIQLSQLQISPKLLQILFVQKKVLGNVLFLTTQIVVYMEILKVSMK